MGPGLFRNGIVRPVNVGVADVAFAPSVRFANGHELHAVAIQSPFAQGMRVHFNAADIRGGRLLVYAPTENGLVVRGPFTDHGPMGTGDFWTATLPGDLVFIELIAAPDAQLVVAEVVHFDRLNTSNTMDAEGAGGPLPCQLDVACEPVNVAARMATGQMTFVKDGSSYVCSGTALNASNSGVPYFITARHCLSTQTAVNSLEVVWDWERDTCTGTLPSYTTLPRNVGGWLLETTSQSDMTFVRLAGGVMNSAFAGWTTATGVNGQGIHHPYGSYKRATWLDDVGTCLSCVCRDPSDFDYYDMINGYLQGGSSGSGVFNASGQLAGQLYGHCGANLDEDCSLADDQHAVYGEFQTSYGYVSRWLIMGDTMHVDAANLSGFEFGTASFPYNTVAEANSAAWPGMRILVEPAQYSELLLLTRQMIFEAHGGSVVMGP